MRLGTGLATAKLGGTTVASIRRGSSTVYDADATTYLKAVEAADGQGLEPAVAKAIQDFVVGLKATSAGIVADPTRTLWDAVQASCIMCGARTISGALVPLKGTAPTPYNLVNFDYTRTGGIEGDGSSTYIDSNRANDADGQDDNHQSVFLSSADTRYASPIGMTYIGASNAANTSRVSIGPYANVLYVNNMCSSQAISGASASATGLLASSRASSSGYSIRSGGSDFSKSVASVSPAGQNHFVFGENAAGSPASITNATLAFYSIGSALDLAALDTKVTALVAAVSAALA